VIGDHQHSGGRRLLVGDVIILSRLLNQAWSRFIARLFGVQRDQSLLITLIAAGAVVEGLQRGASRARQVGSTPPSLGDSFIGATVVKESMNSIVGVKSTDRPFVGTLIAAAVVTKLCHPVVSTAWRRGTARVRSFRMTVRSRYGI